MQAFLGQIQHLFSRTAEHLPQVAITIVVGLIVVELAVVIVGYGLRVSRIPDGLKRLLFSLIRTFLWVILLLVVLQTFNLNNVLVAVTGSSVIAAVFLSAGVAPIVTDILAGLSIASDHSFQPGATVCAGDRKTEGIIETMDLRKTRIRDPKGVLHVIPNSLIDKNEWTILKPRPQGRRLPRRRLPVRLKRKR